MRKRRRKRRGEGGGLLHVGGGQELQVQEGRA